MSDEEFGFGFNDDHLKPRSKRFKAQKGRSYRVGMTWFKGIEDADFGAKNLDPEALGVEDYQLTPMFKSARRVYVDNVGYVIVDDPEIEKIVNQVAPGKKINTYAATTIVSWPLDPDTGRPSKDAFSTKKVQVAPWVINLNAYEVLKKHHLRGNPLHSSDMGLELHPDKPENFQDFQFFPQPGAMFKALLKKAGEGNEDAVKITQHIISQTRDAVANLESQLGRRYTPDQLRDALGIGGSSSANFSGGVSTNDGAEVGDLIGDMLDG